MHTVGSFRLRRKATPPRRLIRCPSLPFGAVNGPGDACAPFLIPRRSRLPCRRADPPSRSGGVRQVVSKGRLGPGQMIACDLVNGGFEDNWTIKEREAAKRPYGDWIRRQTKVCGR